MLNDATAIISNVPGKHLNPLLLAQSQWNDSEGFMMIAYMPQHEESDVMPSRFYDLFFLHGSHIYECARLNSDLRSRLQLDAALKTFQRLGQDEATRVFLFSAATDTLNRFRATFQYEPCLKVQVRGLSVRQIHSLLVGTRCERGIIECNEFVDLVPSIDLRDISSLNDITQYRPPFKRGRILIYDTERNKGLFGEQHDSETSTPKTLTADQCPRPGTGVDRSTINSLDAASASQFSLSDEKEAEEFTEFITRFLKSTPSSPSARPAEAESTTMSSHGDDGQQPSLFVVTRREDNPHLRSTNLSPSPALQGRVEGIPRRSGRNRRSNRSQGTGASQPSADSVEFIRLFERLFRSFRQQVFEIFGDRSDAMIAEAEKKIRFLNPEFDIRTLTRETAALTLDLIEHVTKETPFLKRARLRQAALTMVADLYNKQYELLESNKVIDKVEQFYYRLRK